MGAVKRRVKSAFRGGLVSRPCLRYKAVCPMNSGTLKKRLGHLTLANQLTFLRLVAVPFFVLAILEARFGLALVLFIAAGITDLLDGLVARVFQQRTALGAFLDPAADKLLLTAAFVLLTRYPNLLQTIPMTNRIPLGLTILLISRDVLIVGIALMLNLAYGQTHFKPSLWGKITTGAELVTAGLLLLCNHFKWSPPIVSVAIGATLVLILISGFHYLWRTVRQVREKGTHRASP